MTSSQTAPDYAAITAKHKAAWGTGDFGRVGVTLQTMGERLVEAAEVRAGHRVVDVGCGQGNAAIAAARRFATVFGVDIAPSLLEQGRARAAAEHLDVRFVEGDAQQLPCATGEYDVVLSTVGVMFAPDQQSAADELVRITAPGGRIALASWTPTGLVGAMFGVIGRFNPPPPGVQSPMRWGTQQRLDELFGDRVTWTSTTRTFDFVYRSPQHFSEWFRTYYGPITTLEARLRAEGDTAALTGLDEGLAEVAARFDRATDGTVLAAGEYLESVGTVA